jgi:hypothetical protein
MGFCRVRSDEEADEAEAHYGEAPAGTGESGEDSVFARVQVDFTPVYTCLHIHNALGHAKEFQSYYAENRRLQATLMIQVRSTATPAFL